MDETDVQNLPESNIPVKDEQIPSHSDSQSELSLAQSSSSIDPNLIVIPPSLPNPSEIDSGSLETIDKQTTQPIENLNETLIPTFSQTFLSTTTTPLFANSIFKPSSFTSSLETDSGYTEIKANFLFDSQSSEFDLLLSLSRKQDYELFSLYSKINAQPIYHALNSSFKISSTDLQNIAQDEFLNICVLQRINQLQSENKWSFSQTRQHKSIPRQKTLWDYVIDEMKFVHFDITQEQKLLRTTALIAANQCKVFVNSKNNSLLKSSLISNPMDIDPKSPNTIGKPIIVDDGMSAEQSESNTSPENSKPQENGLQESSNSQQSSSETINSSENSELKNDNIQQASISDFQANETIPPTETIVLNKDTEISEQESKPKIPIQKSISVEPLLSSTTEVNDVSLKPVLSLPLLDFQPSSESSQFDLSFYADDGFLLSLSPDIFNPNISRDHIYSFDTLVQNKTYVDITEANLFVPISKTVISDSLSSFDPLIKNMFKNENDQTQVSYDLNQLIIDSLSIENDDYLIKTPSKFDNPLFSDSDFFSIPINERFDSVVPTIDLFTVENSQANRFNNKFDLNTFNKENSKNTVNAGSFNSYFTDKSESATSKNFQFWSKHDQALVTLVSIYGENMDLIAKSFNTIFQLSGKRKICPQTLYNRLLTISKSPNKPENYDLLTNTKKVFDFNQRQSKWLSWSSLFDKSQKTFNNSIYSKNKEILSSENMSIFPSNKFSISSASDLASSLIAHAAEFNAIRKNYKKRSIDFTSSLSMKPPPTKKLSESKSQSTTKNKKRSISQLSLAEQQNALIQAKLSENKAALKAQTNTTFNYISPLELSKIKADQDRQKSQLAFDKKQAAALSSYRKRSAASQFSARQPSQQTPLSVINLQNPNLQPSNPQLLAPSVNPNLPIPLPLNLKNPNLPIQSDAVSNASRQLVPNSNPVINITKTSLPQKDQHQFQNVQISGQSNALFNNVNPQTMGLHQQNPLQQMANIPANLQSQLANRQAAATVAAVAAAISQKAAEGVRPVSAVPSVDDKQSVEALNQSKQKILQSATQTVAQNQTLIGQSVGNKETTAATTASSTNISNTSGNIQNPSIQAAFPNLSPAQQMQLQIQLQLQQLRRNQQQRPDQSSPEQLLNNAGASNISPAIIQQSKLNNQSLPSAQGNTLQRSKSPLGNVAGQNPPGQPSSNLQVPIQEIRQLQHQIQLSLKMVLLAQQQPGLPAQIKKQLLVQMIQLQKLSQTPINRMTSSSIAYLIQSLYQHQIHVQGLVVAAAAANSNMNTPIASETPNSAGKDLVSANLPGTAGSNPLTKPTLGNAAAASSSNTPNQNLSTGTNPQIMAKQQPIQTLTPNPASTVNAPNSFPNIAGVPNTQNWPGSLQQVFLQPALGNSGAQVPTNTNVANVNANLNAFMQSNFQGSLDQRAKLELLKTLSQTNTSTPSQQRFSSSNALKSQQEVSSATLQMSPGIADGNVTTSNKVSIQGNSPLPMLNQPVLMSSPQADANNNLSASDALRTPTINTGINSSFNSPQISSLLASSKHISTPTTSGSQPRPSPSTGMNAPSSAQSRPGTSHNVSPGADMNVQQIQAQSHAQAQLLTPSLNYLSMPQKPQSSDTTPLPQTPLLNTINNTQNVNSGDILITWQIWPNSGQN
ncbi:hypothetical protein BB560_001955 [Smittium megazygosporum]|uniref:Uncharacterized protein n=2 Tax=Smittium megazygosporum TaxID=133381 RepID=A0A2T9ZG94_9FUNG|nr:hypothetical protein BB560_001955 [Smittium megazygosporum]